jgi:Fe-S cluster assembly protein SufD
VISAAEDAHGSWRQAALDLAGKNGASPWLAACRQAGLASYERLGFPTTRDEAWRFTSVAPILKTTFRAPGRPEALDGTRRDLVEWLRFGAPCALVFVNGRHSARLSCAWPDDSVRLRSLADVLREEPALLERQLGQIAGPATNGFSALSAALLEDGACVTIAPGRVLEAPISLVFLTTSGAGAPVAVHPRVLVLVGRGSQATLVEAYGGPEGEIYLANGVTEIGLEDGARLDHVRVQRESESAFHVATLAVRQGRDSRYRSIALDLGGALARTDIGVLLDGEGAECELDGLFVVDGARHTDTHTEIDHARPHTTSREVYRGIVDGQGQGVFHGRIVVRPDAQKTDAFQLNKNLVLSPTALVHSTPQLQIQADDVRCKHASTTGQIDAAALFYLRSRGIGEAEARALLTHAFAGDIVSRVGLAPVREAIAALLHQRMPGAPEEGR